MNGSSLTFATALAAATLLGGVSATWADDAPGAAITAVCDEDFLADGRYPDARIELGRLLFFDKLLSGNRNISCATCHHPTHGTSNSPASRMGEAALGLGLEHQVQESAFRLSCATDGSDGNRAPGISTTHRR
jgi:cytochrome c peroxidase